MTNELQSVRFDKNIWTQANAAKWLQKHNIIAKSMRVLNNEIRYIIRDAENYLRFRIIFANDKNVKFIIGFNSLLGPV